MDELDKWCSEFRAIVPVNEQTLTPNEAAFHCLQGVSYLIDKLVNVGYKNLLTADVNDSSEEDTTRWCTIEELCNRHPELRKSNVVSRSWRLENNFPCKSGYKCRQMFFEPDVIEWINHHFRGKNVTTIVSTSKKNHSQKRL